MGVLCAPWVTRDDLPTDRPALTDAEWDRILDAASEVLYGLTGRRFGGVCTTSATLEGVPSRGRSLAYWSGTGDLFGWTAQEPAALCLPDGPVREVVEVRVGDTVLDPAGYRLRRPRYLDRVGCAGWDVCRPITVTYRYGSTPPAAGIEAAIVYALNLGKARTGDDTCALPGNVTQVARQGITTTRLTARDLARDGLVGIASVDQWIATVNPHRSTRRPRVWSANVDPARTYRNPVTP